MFKNIIANVLGRLWGTISNFLFIPLYIKYLGFESYSIISFTLVVAGFMMIFGAGVTATLSREFARSDYSLYEKIRVFNTLETTYLLLVVTCSIFVFILSDYIASDWVNIVSYSPEKITYFIKIIAIDASFQLMIKLYMGGMLGLEKHIKANAFQIGWGMCRNGLVVLVILFNPTLENFFIWQCISSITFAVLLRLSLCKLLIGKYLYFKLNLNISILKRIWYFSLGMFLIALVAGINTQLDKLIIGLYLPIEELGYYTLSVSLAMGLVVIVNPISSALLPRFTHLYTSNQTKKATDLFNGVSLYVTILIFTFMSNMIFNAEALLWVWTGNIAVAKNASVYLPIIALSMAMLGLQVMPYSIAIANGYTKLNNTLGLCSLLITLPGYWFATKAFGAMGAALVFCVVQVITAFLYLYFIQKMFLGGKRILYGYIRLIFFPLIMTLFFSYILSLISLPTEHDRISTLIEIGCRTFLTLILTILLLDLRRCKKYVSQLWRWKF